MRCRAAPVLLLALGLADCGSSPTTHFYALDPVPVSEPAPSRRLTSPIVVGHVQLPSELDRQGLVTHGPGSTIDVSDQEQWAAPLDELVRRALTTDLRSRLPPESVLAPGDPTPKDTRTLALNIRRFMADESGRVTLAADWAVQSGSTPAALHRASVTVDAGSRNGDAVVTAMNQAVGKLADQIAAAL